MSRFSGIYLRPRFFQVLGVWLGVVALCNYLPALALFLTVMAGIVFGMITLADLVILYRHPEPVAASRELAAVLSLGSDNPVLLRILNRSDVAFDADLLEELPAELQIRSFRLQTRLPAGEETVLSYKINPRSRGRREFGNIRIFIRTRLGLAERGIRAGDAAIVSVFPSVTELKNHQLMASARISTREGIRKIRRTGHSYDFDHIRDYARGDDPRTINWKATGKLSRIMVNHYEDQKSQQVYALLDLGRNMSSPFDNMSLLDYSINATLTLSGIILTKEDRAGILGFGDLTHTFLPAERGKAQLGRIMKTLHDLKEGEGDASLERIFYLIRHHIRIRSLLIYFTNIESMSQLERLLPMLERIKARHLLVVVLFENTEAEAFTREAGTDLDEIYACTVARQYLFEKQQIALRLRRSGIFTILTQPRNLTIQSVNQYLELKARGLV